MPADNPADQSYEGIIVLGAPRSGTTLVRRLLNAHPNICCPPETNLLSAASRFLHEERFAGGLAVGVLNGLGFSGYEEAEVTERIRDFVFSFFREIAQKGGKPRWAEKTAFDSFYLSQIERICGDHCRYVCVFRHGLDAVCSVKELCDKMEIFPPELQPYIRQYAAPLEAFAHAWADVNRRLMKFISDHRDSCFALKYEDLLSDPEKQLTDLFDFLDEPADVRMQILPVFGQGSDVGLGDWKTYELNTLSKASKDRWRVLSDDTVTWLAPIVNPVMKQIGYDTIEEKPPTDGKEARHLYQVSRMIVRLASGVQSREDSRDEP